MKILTVCFAVTALTLAPLALTAQDKSAATNAPLIEIVEQLEREGSGPFSECSQDHGNWEIEVWQDGAAYELTVDPRTKKVLSRHRDDAEQLPPKDALPLSKVLRKLSGQAGFGKIDEVSFERRFWEVEAEKDGQWHEIHVDPRSGKVISDRLDD